MDSRDIERLDQMLQFQRLLIEKQIQMQGMVAANLSQMGTVAYTEEDFAKLLDGIGYNDYPYYRG